LTEHSVSIHCAEYSETRRGSSVRRSRPSFIGFHPAETISQNQINRNYENIGITISSCNQRNLPRWQPRLCRFFLAVFPLCFKPKRGLALWDAHTEFLRIAFLKLVICNGFHCLLYFKIQEITGAFCFGLIPFRSDE
jgi:hypothetical protein